MPKGITCLVYIQVVLTAISSFFLSLFHSVSLSFSVSTMEYHLIFTIVPSYRPVVLHLLLTIFQNNLLHCQVNLQLESMYIYQKKITSHTWKIETFHRKVSFYSLKKKPTAKTFQFYSKIIFDSNILFSSILFDWLICNSSGMHSSWMTTRITCESTEYFTSLFESVFLRLMCVFVLISSTVVHWHS